MSKADQVREYLKENPTGNCKEAFAGFVEETKLSMHYSQFNTIFRKYCDKNNVEIVKATREVGEEDLPYEEKELHGSTFKMKCWKDLDTRQVVTEESVGKLVEIAGESITYKVKQYHHKGDPMWPAADGVTVENEKYGKRFMYIECLKISS